MLTLYVKTGCPYCARVLRVVEDLSLVVKEKNISDPAIAAELIDRGGKRQVPYLIDDENNVAMYESEDIVSYLNEKHGKGKEVISPPAPSKVCPIDHDKTSESA